MLDLHRNWFHGLETKTAAIFAVLPLTPNQYTSFSIVFAMACAYSLYIGHYWLALLFFMLAGAMDFIDGAVARAKNLASPKGAHWDNIADRYVEAIVLLGLLSVSLPNMFLSAYVWIFLVLFGSMMTTYAKASAKEKGLSDAELKGGLMSRAERLIFYFLAIVFLNYNLVISIYIVAVLALLSNFTALQRIHRALNLTK